MQELETHGRLIFADITSVQPKLIGALELGESAETPRDLLSNLVEAHIAPRNPV
jgi:hypothetical protein